MSNTVTPASAAAAIVASARSSSRSSSVDRRMQPRPTRSSEASSHAGRLRPRTIARRASVSPGQCCCGRGEVRAARAVGDDRREASGNAREVPFRPRSRRGAARRRRRRLLLPRVPRGVAGDDTSRRPSCSASSAARSRGASSSRTPTASGRSVREPVQRFARGDVRLRHELEDEDRAVDRRRRRRSRARAARPRRPRSRPAAPASVGDAQRQTAATRSAASATRSSASRPERTASTIAA